MKKVLFIAAHRPGRSPSQRFRFEQYFSYLNKNGFFCELSYLLSEKDDILFYKSGSFLSKAFILAKGILIRFYDVFRAFSFDIVFIQREAHFFGTSFFEQLFRYTGAKIVFDFDDAIWHFDISEGNKRFSFLKNPSKTASIIRKSHMVFAGNEYLRNYALGFNNRVLIVPTTIDTVNYKCLDVNKGSKPICIGWSGSLTTIVHFRFAISFLKKIQEIYNEKVCFKVIGYANYEVEGLNLESIGWSKDSEVEDLSTIDIGIMPLPKDEWAKGKCGLKGLQYMALGIPTIMSPVGVNSTIIEHGKNGFLASSEEDWVSLLCLLIENVSIRRKLGQSARKTVEVKYSIEANENLYLSAFKELLS
mgnify:CR=1 FL=1|tara:strand:- start:36 stop:1118 length:1083 start_codon:yes stop_codon:yes gene_type:complete